jgi:hypothetical protein
LTKSSKPSRVPTISYGPRYKTSFVAPQHSVISIKDGRDYKIKTKKAIRYDSILI